MIKDIVKCGKLEKVANTQKVRIRRQKYLDVGMTRGNQECQMQDGYV